MSGRRTTHDYHGCYDKDCPLPYCRIWREAREEIDKAYREGYTAGYADGYGAGFAAGLSAAGGK